MNLSAQLTWKMDLNPATAMSEGVSDRMWSLKVMVEQASK